MKTRFLFSAIIFLCFLPIFSSFYPIENTLASVETSRYDTVSQEIKSERNKIDRPKIKKKQTKSKKHRHTAKAKPDKKWLPGVLGLLGVVTALGALGWGIYFFSLPPGPTLASSVTGCFASGVLTFLGIILFIVLIGGTIVFAVLAIYLATKYASMNSFFIKSTSKDKTNYTNSLYQEIPKKYPDFPREILESYINAKIDRLMLLWQLDKQLIRPGEKRKLESLVTEKEEYIRSLEKIHELLLTIRPENRMLFFNLKSSLDSLERQEKKLLQELNTSESSKIKEMTTKRLEFIQQKIETTKKSLENL